MTEPDVTTMEQQVAELQQAIAARRAAEGLDAQAPPERSEVYDAVGEQIQQVVPTYVPAPTPTQAGGETPSWQDPALADTVQQLVQIAFTQGVTESITQAEKTGNAALLDALHDILADEMHAELLAQKKIEAAV